MQSHHDQYGISFIALRIGGVLTEPDWHRRSHAGLAMLISHRDAAQLVERSIEAPSSVGYAVVYGMSNNALRIHDIESAEELLEYRPQDDAGTELLPGVEDGPYFPRAHSR